MQAPLHVQIGMHQACSLVGTGNSTYEAVHPVIHSLVKIIAFEIGVESLQYHVCFRAGPRKTFGRQLNSYFGGVTAEVVEKLFELAPLLLVVPRKTNHILPESMEGKVENRGC